MMDTPKRPLLVAVVLGAILFASPTMAQTSSTWQVRIDKLEYNASPDPACAGPTCGLMLNELCVAGLNFGPAVGTKRDIVLGNQSLKALPQASISNWSDTAACVSFAPIYYDPATYQVVVYSGNSDSNGKPYSASGFISLGGATPGPAGPKGDKGNPGTAGATGAKGDKGDPGAAGPAGPKGDQGNNGSKGDKGDNGKDGHSRRGWGHSGCLKTFLVSTPTTLSTQGPVTGEASYSVEATIRAPWADGQKAIRCTLTATENNVSTVFDSADTLIPGNQKATAKGEVRLKKIYTPSGGAAASVTFSLACQTIAAEVNGRVVEHCHMEVQDIN